MKKKVFSLLPYVPIIIIGVIFFAACQDPFYDDVDTLILKKGQKPADVEQGDLYGDLWELQRDDAGVPLIYPLKYRADYQDNLVEGIIDVVNPRLSEPFVLEALVRDSLGYVVYISDDVPDTYSIYINPVDGFVIDTATIIALYDAEGEVLPDVARYVYPVEEGRLNIIRSPSSVLDQRLTEVIKNFGDGTVADVVRDFCGRLMMVRINSSTAEDKPIDSPLESLAIYKELMLNGFSNSARDNGLRFLVEDDNGLGGFNFQFRLDGSFWDWDTVSPRSYSSLSGNYGDQCQLIANLASSCVATGSDKSSILNIDEIVFLNLFMGIPEVVGNGINTPASSVTCFLPTREQEIRMMDKTDKHQYSKFRYYVDYSGFAYDRTKFEKTLLDYVTIVGDYDPVTGNLIGSHTETLAEDITLDEILRGDAPLTVDASGIYRYTHEDEDFPKTGAYGFANQADDYVQALEVVHNNEEFLIWKIPTPTWYHDHGFNLTVSPFIYAPDETSHSKKPDGKGDNEGKITSTNSGKGRRGGR